MERIKLTLGESVTNDERLFVESAYYYDYLNTVVLKPYFFSGTGINVGDRIAINEYSSITATEIDGYICESGDVVSNPTLISEEPELVRRYILTVTSVSNDTVQAMAYDSLNSLLDNTSEDYGLLINDGNLSHYAEYSIIKNYRSIELPITVNEDFKGLNKEANINQILSDSLDGIIPGVIDMEKLKYCPFFSGDTGETSGIVTGITFKLHFLDRDHESIEKRGFISKSRNWCSGSTGTTNVMAESDEQDSSTLLGRIGFTDGDVYYRKNKLSKSFIRLSFYRSNDPVSNALLYYSTIFMDGGELYGEYVNLERLEGKNIVDEYDLVTNNGHDGNRLDASVTVTTEYDETRATEGFNLYLFSSDKDIKDIVEDGESGYIEKPYRTIYMKVDFNHAGFGKTIQFVRPSGESEAFSEMDDYFDSVFIPLRVWYEETLGKYVYSFTPDRCHYNEETKSLYMDLYEAVLKEEDNG